ncbi:MAG: D-alanyl-D-alanine carboxypeptidase family protein [Gammaproteobacteria bacterium]|nr:D-alanyl-D-alanine carboxypeptidase family protein [Gammaproteobacteria bacterium]
MDEALRCTHRRLGIPTDYQRTSGLPVQVTPDDLVSIGCDVFGRPQRLRADAAEAWSSMQSAANEEGIEVQIVSAFRSVEYQTSLVERLLNQGQSIEDILTRVAAPGFSEHQSGCALDLTTEHTEPLEEEFEETAAFEWLTIKASKFSFYLSYPRGNEFGVIYEPWHWCYRIKAD